MNERPERGLENLAIEVVRTLKAYGHTAFFVGGCVRDRLLGLQPKDFDISTSAVPELLLKYFPAAQTVGAHFGVILVTQDDGSHVEVATFRTEGAYSDGRRPDAVRFVTDPAVDAKRRDFTINGLMQDPLSGTILDFVNGRHDLGARIIRAIGNPEDRFLEDHLRMLRAVRFAARLDFQIAPDTMTAIQRLAPAITTVSDERTRDELARILTEGGARRGFEMLDECGLLQQLLPEVKAFQGVPQPPEFHPEGDVWTHVLLMLGQLKAPSFTLAAGALLHDIGKPPTFQVTDRIRFNGHAETGAQMAADIAARLRFPNEEAEQVVSLVANHMKFKDVLQMRTSTLKRFLRLPHFEEHLELHRLDCLASNGYTAAYDFVVQKLAEFGKEELRPPRLITGRDLIYAGHKPGPCFSRALEAVETAQLEGEIKTREEALIVASSLLAACET